MPIVRTEYDNSEDEQSQSGSRGGSARRGSSVLGTRREVVEAGGDDSGDVAAAGEAA
jgi:hypothetical protein